jgi:hypothetical protein
MLTFSSPIFLLYVWQLESCLYVPQLRYQCKILIQWSIKYDTFSGGATDCVIFSSEIQKKREVYTER